MACSCEGKCCSVFTYTSTPEQLRIEPWRGTQSQRDNLYVADMLIPLTAEEAKERSLRFDVSGAEDRDYSKLQWYTCRHWDESTMLCTAYEDRPPMCREFPYGKPCDHGCAYEIELDLLAIIERREMENGFITNITLGEN